MKLSAVRLRAAFMLMGIMALPAGLRGAGMFSQAVHKIPLTVGDVLSHMDDAARRLKTISARLSYTTVTVLVNDRATQSGYLFFRKGRRPEVLVRFSKPETKVILFKKNRAEVYYPRINQIQEYDLEKRRDLLQQFLLLGFGTGSGKLEGTYHVRYLGEKTLGGTMTPVLELTPIPKDVAAQLSKVDLWISPQSWLPVQQEFFEASGDYLIASYSHMRINEPLGSSTFKIRAKHGAERVKMN